MIPFSVSYLATFTIRAEMPEAGRQVAAAIALAAVIALWRRPAPRMDQSRGALCAATLGVLLACGQNPPHEPGPRRAAVSLDESGEVARVTGVVEAGGRVDSRGAWFDLRGGPHVRVLGARYAPPPGATIVVLGRLDASATVVVAASWEALSVAVPAPAISCARFFESLRQICRERIGSACPPETARVLLPLLIGDTGLPEDFREDLARTGTLHIVAVSGTHLSLFLAGLRIFTRRLRLLVPMLVLYAGMCAFEPPVLRSLVLSLGFLCGRRLGRALPEGAHFLLSACIVLSFDPAAFFDAGFQLSFSAFGGIIALGTGPRAYDPFQEARERSSWKRIARILSPAAKAGAGATLATAPAMIWRFNRISPVGVPATLLLSPFIPVLLWLGALIILFPSVRPFSKLATALIDLLLHISAAISAMPLASVDVPRPHTWALATFAGVIVLLALSEARRWSGIRIAVVFISSALVLVPDRAAPGLYQLAAGKGAANLLVSTGGAALVDAGPASARVCEQVLKLGIKTLDLVVLTHDHSDHTGGLDQVLARLGVRRVVAGPTCRRLAGSVPGDGSGIWSAGDSFEKAGLLLRALWPPESHAGPENDRSLVIHAEIDGLRALLCGDIESAGLVELLRTDAIRPVDALLLPHHGSANDGLCDLLLRTRPTWALVSARPGAPSEETLRILGIFPSEVRATYLEGVIEIPSKP